MFFKQNTIISFKVTLNKTKQILQDHYNKTLQLLPLYFLFYSQTKDPNSLIYYVCVFLISNLVFFYNQSFYLKVMNKNIIFHMLKPIQNYPKYRFKTDLITNIYSFFIGLFEFALLIRIFHINLFIKKQNYLDLIYLFIYLILGIIIGYLIYTLISQIALWIENADIQTFISYQVILFFSGFYLPINYFPKFLQKIIFITPFPYLFYYPINIIIKKNIEYTNSIILGFVWVLVLYKIAKIMWKKGSDQFYD